MTSKFSQTEVSFLDTLGKGGVSVRGIELQADKDGFIDGPPDLEKDLVPHGFVRKTRETHASELKAAAAKKDAEEKTTVAALKAKK